MNHAKFIAILAIVVLCLFAQQAVEAHFMGKVGHDIHKAAHTVDKVASHVDNAKKVIAVGSAIAGAAGVAAL